MSVDKLWKNLMRITKHSALSVKELVLVNLDKVYKNIGYISKTVKVVLPVSI